MTQLAVINYGGSEKYQWLQKKKESATDYDIGHFPLQNTMHFYKSDLTNKAKNLMIVHIFNQFEARFIPLAHTFTWKFHMKTRNLSLAVD